jgi:hypothetical protein
MSEQTMQRQEIGQAAKFLMSPVHDAYICTPMSREILTRGRLVASYIEGLEEKLVETETILEMYRLAYPTHFESETND